MPIPAGITPITVTGTYLAADGTARAGTVSFVPSIPAADPTDKAILPLYPTTVTLVNGMFSVILAATDDPQWAAPGWTYEVTEKITGAVARVYSIEVPAASAGGTLDLASAAPVAAVPSVAPYAIDTAVVHKSGAETITGDKTFSGAKLTTAASSTSKAGVNLPHGAAPSAPADGDMWTTSAGLFVRINGVSVGPLS